MILIVMMVITICLQDNFFSLRSMINMANSFFPLIMMTIGQSVIIISGAVDLSNGAALSLMTCILAQTMEKDNPVTSIYAILLLIAAGLAVGLLNGLAIGVMRVTPVIATFATTYIYLGAGLMILPIPGGECVNWMESFYNLSLVDGAPQWLTGIFNIIPPAVWELLLVVLVWMIIKRMKFGRYLYATGSNEENAYVSGINTGVTRVKACLFNSFCIMVAALFFVAQNQSGDYELGTAFTLKSLAAAVIGGVSMSGGRGSVSNAIIGALIFSFVSKIIFFADFSTAYQTLVSGLIVIIALLVSYIYSVINERAKLKGGM